MFDDVLDLLERAPEPVMRVDPDGIVSAGRRTKRRRRALTLFAGAGAVAALGIGAFFMTGWSQRAQDVAPAGGSARGATPTTVTSTATPSPVAEAKAAQTWGPMHVMSQQPNRQGGRPALYLTPDRMLCIGTIDAQDDLTPSVCRQIKAPPSDAFGTGYAWSMYGDLPAGVVANEFIAGVVASDVTKVVVRTERGDVTAHLTPAPDPSLGQLYWVETGVPILASDMHAKDRSRVAYRGTKVAFSCGYYECVGR